ncbi:MAG TPA: hypothetical protein VF756_25235 [Thermoanaerobaculia bacterium]
MAEPNFPPPSPFNPEGAAPIRPASAGGGCGKPWVIGCLALLVLAGIGLIVGVWYAGKNYDKLMLWSFDQIRGGVMTRLPDDLPAVDRDRLETAFTDARSTLEKLKQGPDDAQRIQPHMMELTRKAQGEGKLTVEEVREITGILEKIAGAPSP